MAEVVAIEVSASVKRAEPVHARAVKGGLVSGVSFVATLGLNLLQVPLLLRCWPQETYGLWLSVGALATVLTTLDGGHQLYIGNLLNRYYVEDRTLYRRTLASAVQVAILTSSIQIALAAMLCLSGSAARWMGISAGDGLNFSVAVLIYTVGWISTGSVGAILVRIFPPTGFFVRATWWGVGTKGVQFLAVAASASLGLGLVPTSLVFVGTTLIFNIVLLIDIKRLFPDIYPWWKSGDFGLGLGNLLRSGVLTAVSLMDLFTLQGIVLLVAGGLGAAIVPVFTTVRTLANTAMQGTGFLLNPIIPDIVRYHVNKEVEKLSAVFACFWFTSNLAIGGGILIGLFFVEPLYGVWTQGRLGFDRALFAWLAAAVLVRTLAAPVQNYLSAINRLPELLATATVRVGLAAGGVLLLASHYGLGGVGMALFISELAGALILPAFFARKILFANGRKRDREAVIVACVSTLVACSAVALYGFQVPAWKVAVVLALVTEAIATAVQWKLLAPEVRSRLGSVVKMAGRFA